MGVKLKGCKTYSFWRSKEAGSNKEYYNHGWSGRGDLDEIEKQIEKLKAIMQDTENSK